MSSWKTTLVGVGLAVFTALANYSGPNQWQGYVVACGLAAFGILAKDYNVTGN